MVCLSGTVTPSLLSCHCSSEGRRRRTLCQCVCVCVSWVACDRGQLVSDTQAARPGGQPGQGSWVSIAGGQGCGQARWWPTGRDGQCQMPFEEASAMHRKVGGRLTEFRFLISLSLWEPRGRNLGFPVFFWKRPRSCHERKSLPFSVCVPVFPECSRGLWSTTDLGFPVIILTGPED